MAKRNRDNNRDDSMTTAEAGHLGGEKVLDERGTEYFEAIGSQGGQASGGNSGGNDGGNGGGGASNNPGNFANDPEKASRAGEEGGRNSHGGGGNNQ